MNARSHRSRILLSAVGSLALLVSACSTSGDGSDATAAPKTTTTVEKPTTTDAEATTTTDVKDDRPTTADLEVILPSAADIGTGWKLDPPDDEDSDSDQALEEQCPAFADLGTGDHEDDARHAFTGPQNAQIAVSLSNDADEVSKAELEDQLNAVNDCDPISYTDRGLTTTLDLQVKPDDTYGDFGARMQADITLESDALPQPVKLTLYGLMFRIDEVGVSITGSDGLDDDTLKVAPIDTDLLIAQAEAMEQAVKNLGAG